MYEMLTGVPAYGGSDTYSVMWRHVNELPSRLPFLDSEIEVPIRLMAAVFKLISIEIENRFQTAQELKDELSEIYTSCAD